MHILALITLRYHTKKAKGWRKKPSNKDLGRYQTKTGEERRQRVKKRNVKGCTRKPSNKRLEKKYVTGNEWASFK